MPRPWNHKLWMSETTVSGIVGVKTRSPQLLAVDQALKTYDFANPFNKLKALHLLLEAFDKWKAIKADPNNSIRNKGGVLLGDFQSWMNDELNNLLPARETGWNGTPNCYAYAMKCKNIVGQVPTPGAAAGNAIVQRPGVGVDQYVRDLLQAIVADGTACGKQVQILQTLGSPAGPPVDQASSTHYLAAMVVKSDGFHFMRRDSTTGLWSHKNGGADAEVERSAVLLATAGQLRVREVPITDAVAVELLECGEGKYLAFSGFKFAGYVLVPHEGITVRGARG